jgi:hypothetical protein
MSSYRHQRSDFKKFIFVSVGFFVLSSALNWSTSSAYTTDTTVYAPPDYLTFQPPDAGGSYTDPVFGTAIKRLTNSMTMPDIARGGVVTSIAPEYSTMTPFNLDNTRLLLTHFSYFALYDGAGNFLRNLPFDVNTSSEPRWSRTDPNVFYYVSGNTLKQYNIGNNSITVLHTFTEYTRISGEGESDICFDGNHLVLAGDHRYIFVYQISSDTTGSVLDTGGRGFDSLYITPNDNITITWLSNGSSRFTGIELFDMNMNFLRQLTHAGGHMDVTRDVNGDEVLVWADYGDGQLQVPCTAGIMKVRLSDASQTCIWKADWSLAAHVSAPDGNGWVFVETYAPSDPIPPNGWNVYTNELLQVKIDGTEVRRLAHHRSRPFNSYTWQPKISTSRDGTKVVFGSNFGLQAILGYPREYSDAYMIDLASSPSTPPTSSLNAVYLGVTGQDYVGPQLSPNGNPDWHIQLHGLRGTPTRVLVTSDTGGIWEFPPNAAGNWVVLPQYDGAGNADLWFEPWSSQRFHVKVWYSDGSTDEADAASSTSVSNTSTLKAFYLGVTGQDNVGPGLSPNGNPDWHIQLRGLRGTPTRVLITSDTGGIWEFPPNAAGNWVVLPQYDGAGNADLWFEPWSSQRFHVKVWYSDGSTDESDAL